MDRRDFKVLTEDEAGNLGTLEKKRLEEILNHFQKDDKKQLFVPINHFCPDKKYICSDKLVREYNCMSIEYCLNPEKDCHYIFKDKNLKSKIILIDILKNSKFETINAGFCVKDKMGQGYIDKLLEVYDEKDFNINVPNIPEIISRDCPFVLSLGINFCKNNDECVYNFQNSEKKPYLISLDKNNKISNNPDGQNYKVCMKNNAGDKTYLKAVKTIIHSQSSKGF